ncbi:hypothetical protein FRC10_002648 [Ceratobasidium sp. 414]|nr:hypothetical protein FRC10_002648 [Ceratobasidium sp. 414]
MYGHYESSLLTKAIAAALFGGPYSVGITFHDYFEPMPLITVTFILANMQFCIEQWETGQWVPRDLSTSDMLNKYVVHLQGLKEARAAAQGRMGHLQDHWFDFGFHVHPDTPISDDGNPAIGSALELSSDAQMDLSEEPETYPDGCYTVKAKGKGCAC